METINGNNLVKKKHFPLECNCEYELVLPKFNFLGLPPYILIEDEPEKKELIIETDENILRTFEVSISGDKISFYNDENIMYKFSNFFIVLRANVKELVIDGCYDLRVTLRKSPKINFLFSGNSTSNILVKNAEIINLKTSGNVSILAGGTTKKFQVDLSGNSRVDSVDLISQKVVANLNGTSKLSVYVNSELSASVAGVSKLSYKGNPAWVNNDTSGLGEVVRIPL